MGTCAGQLNDAELEVQTQRAALEDASQRAESLGAACDRKELQVQDMTTAAEQLEERLKARRCPASEAQPLILLEMQLLREAHCADADRELGAAAELGLLALLSCTSSSPDREFTQHKSAGSCDTPECCPASYPHVKSWNAHTCRRKGRVE